MAVMAQIRQLMSSCLGRTVQVTWTACLLTTIYDVGYLVQMGVDLVR